MFLFLSVFFLAKINNLEYATELTVLFMRLSVMTTDMILMVATWCYLSNKSRKFFVKISFFVMIVFNSGLLLVDHIHFQYNGLLVGLLLLCVHLADTSEYQWLALCFSCLVLMKHLFLPLAPVFAVYLVRNYCFTNSSDFRTFSLIRFFHLAAIAVFCLLAAFGPFLACVDPAAQIQQMFQRLFPFGRGLVHAYWAPNVWALYCALDKVLHILISKLVPSAALVNNSLHLNDSTSGVVGDFALFVLPRISAAHCIVLLSFCLPPAVWVLCQGRRVSTAVLLRALTFVSLSSFMLGYHVHEKAVLVPMALQTLVVFGDSAQSVPFLMMVAAGVFGLFPLFEGHSELMIKSNLLVLVKVLMLIVCFSPN
jgi:alpha-1,3-glucosyltransferase